MATRRGAAAGADTDALLEADEPAPRAAQPPRAGPAATPATPATPAAPAAPAAPATTSPPTSAALPPPSGAPRGRGRARDAGPGDADADPPPNPDAGGGAERSRRWGAPPPAWLAAQAMAAAGLRGPVTPDVAAAAVAAASAGPAPRASPASAAAAAAGTPPPPSSTGPATSKRVRRATMTLVLAAALLGALVALQTRNEIDEIHALLSRGELRDCVVVMGTSPRAARRGCELVAATEAVTRLDLASARGEQAAVASALEQIRRRAGSETQDESAAAAAAAKTFCWPPEVAVSPKRFAAESLREDRGEGICHLIVYAEDGRDAAFDEGFSSIESWARFAPEPEPDTEDWIDEACLRRRKRVGPKGLPCTIREVPVLRAARKWAVLVRETLALPRTAELVPLPLAPASASEPLPAFAVHKLSHRELVADLVPRDLARLVAGRKPVPAQQQPASGDAAASSTASDAPEKAERALAGEGLPFTLRLRRLGRTLQLVKGEASILARAQTAEQELQAAEEGGEPRGAAGAEAAPATDAAGEEQDQAEPLSPEPLPDAPDAPDAPPTAPSAPATSDGVPLRDAPLEKPVDAGSCWVAEAPRTGAIYARCLPSFLVIGAQKAGTDELAVWLNFNLYHRRLDGGPETHFFDCVGRGRGQHREPCLRGRSYAFERSQSMPGVPRLGNDTKNAKNLWSWERVRSQARFNRVDELWEKYAGLGRLTRSLYFLQPSRTLLYEKTPSYSDLADVRDVARLLPSARVVFLSRDPVARLYSSYWQACSDLPKAQRLRCGVEDYEEKVLHLVNENVATDPEFKRSAEHGFYGRNLRPWLERFTHKNQVLVVDAHHFHYLPQAVVFAVETFVGNRGGPRHHTYHPQWKDGFWVLGEYSKASHPSHRHDREPSANVTALLTRWYEPHVLEYFELLRKFKGVVALGAVGEHIPSDMRAIHPTLFRPAPDRDSFGWPPWMLDVLKRRGVEPYQ